MVISRDALWDSGHDETVEVNQRALIDKVLARYSGEFTVFRELLQNSDDAQSKAVEIHFQTQSFLDEQDGKLVAGGSTSTTKGHPDLKTALIAQWTFRNNGIVFREEDWNRLKKIAEGNPDEEKIGAFGVGFYSLFSVTEDPLVTSGDQWMGFYWKDRKDQLYARRGKLPESEIGQNASWTTFAMPLRESTPMPVPFDFTRFLASSITFMTHLSEISVYFNGYRLARLLKSSGVPQSLTLPKGLISRSPTGNMVVDTLQSTSLHIKAEVIQLVYASGTEKKRVIPSIAKPSSSGFGGGFFASLFSSRSTPTPTPAPLPPAAEIDPMAVNETSVSLKIYSASVAVRLDKKLAAELQRATKKNPPTRMKYELIYTGKAEYDVSLEEEKKYSSSTGSIFQGLRADLDGSGSGRIFIGHSTAQTTGLGGHMAGRFIPTVEREAIDFMDRNVAVWNRELLYVGGFLARSAYELELRAIQAHWDAVKSASGDLNAELQSRLTAQVVHALKFFTFHKTTPSSEVSNLLENAFFASSQKGDFSIISTQGIRNIKDVRLPDPAFSGFIKDLPILSEEMMTDARPTVSTLQARGLLHEITFTDVLNELRSRPLSHGEFVACLNWWISVYKGDEERLLPIRTQLIDAVILTVDADKVIPLNTIRYFINPRTPYGSIPLDGPLPDDLLPNSVSKEFKSDVLASCFPWTEFTVVQWITFLCTTKGEPIATEWDVSVSSMWADRVLGTLARAWPTISAPAKNHICKLLSEKTCVPTSCGMKPPAQAYFPNVNMFHDLPIVTLPSGTAIKGNLEKVLQDMGVRKHVELQIVFNRMIKTNEWTIHDLTRYLVSVRSTLSAEEIERLKATAAFPKEDHSKGDAEQTKRTRHMAKQLYEPLDVFRTLQLPIIDWGKQAKWKNSSEEAKFLFDLGLRRYPPLDVIIPLCGSDDIAIRTAALQYLIDGLASRYRDYDPFNFKNIAFIPALRGADKCLAKVHEVFANPDWSVMGFLVVQPSLRGNASKLKIAENPPPSQLISLLESKPPQFTTDGKAWFGLLSTRVNEFTNTQLVQLSNLRFVPVPTPKGDAGPTVQWLPPNQCYLGGGAHQTFHSKLFIFVDFGVGGNAFLSACGARDQPTVEEVVKILLNNPFKFYDLAGGPTNFLAELRNIAINVKGVSSPTMTRMKRSPVLLGLRRQIKDEKKRSTNDLDEDEFDIVYDLKKPDQIVIADDTQAYQTFGDELFTAPQEDILEAFYSQLGSRRLSQIVKEDYQPTAEINNSKVATEIRSLILERLPLFLHEHTHTSTKVSYSWLAADGHLVVKTFGKITVVKTLHHGNSSASRKQDASAVARKASPNQIQLWIAVHSQVDMYEVATSLNRLLFEAPKTNDALLFMTILSTDLRSLKRRGYNVDRILRQQREAQIDAENARLKSEANTRLASRAQEAINEKPKERMEPPTPVPGAFPAPSLPPPETSNDVKQMPGSNSTGSFVDTFQKLKRKIAPGPSTPFGGTNDSQATLTAGTDEHRQTPPQPSPKPRSSPGPNETSLENISRNIEVAINSCRKESGDVLHNRERMEVIKESLNEGYCDISGRAGNLRHIGNMDVVKVYLGQEVPTELSTNFMNTHRGAIARFIHIMKLLADTYQVPLANLHIFYDLQGDLIAFNRGGSIFLNLRYFEAWHDRDVSQSRLNQACISWYFTLAHEMAHNLVQPHNSEHEFYMSAICEKYLLGLTRVLSQ